MTKNQTLLSVAGWLIVTLLTLLSWFTNQGIKNNKSEHTEIMDELKLIKTDIGNIKYIIIEYHPKSINRFYNTDITSRGVNPIPKPYEQFNCIVSK